jgi:hypothetical protein
MGRSQRVFAKRKSCPRGSDRHCRSATAPGLPFGADARLGIRGMNGGAQSSELWMIMTGLNGTGDSGGSRTGQGTAAHHCAVRRGTRERESSTADLTLRLAEDNDNRMGLPIAVRKCPKVISYGSLSSPQAEVRSLEGEKCGHTLCLGGSSESGKSQAVKQRQREGRPRRGYQDRRW